MKLPLIRVAVFLSCVFLTILLFTSFNKNLGTYATVEQTKRTIGTVSVIAELEKESVMYYKDGNLLLFDVVDSTGTMVVEYYNPMPANMMRSEKIVMKGRWNGKAFVAENILVKCPSKYNGVEDVR